MKAIILNGFGGIDQLHYTTIPVPAVGEDEVLILVKAISINPVDVKTRMGKGVAGRLKEISPFILGWDVSGIVTATGPNVTKFKTGDEVFGMVNFPGHGKAYAEYVTAPANQLALKPSNISHEEAAAATLVGLTAWQALVDTAHVQPGQRILIHAAAGGVGHFAVQLGKHLGAHVTGTSSAANEAFVFNLGADAHIDYHAHRFEDVIQDMDFVLDTVGGEIIDRSLNTIKRGGSIVSIVSGLSETVAEKANAKGIQGQQILVKSDGEDMDTIADLLQAGVIKIHVSHVFPFDQMGTAHLQIESGRTVGKVVVQL